MHQRGDQQGLLWLAPEHSPTKSLENIAKQGEEHLVGVDFYESDVFCTAVAV